MAAAISVGTPKGRPFLSQALTRAITGTIIGFFAYQQMSVNPTTAVSKLWGLILVRPTPTTTAARAVGP